MHDDGTHQPRLPTASFLLLKTTTRRLDGREDWQMASIYRDCCGRRSGAGVGQHADALIKAGSTAVKTSLEAGKPITAATQLA